MTSGAMKFVLLWYKIISMPPTSSREVFHGFPFQICPKDSGRVRRVFYKENVKCYVMPLEKSYAPPLQVRGEQKHSVGKHSRMNYESPCPWLNHLRSSHCISLHTSVILWSFQALPKFWLGIFSRIKYILGSTKISKSCVPSVVHKRV